MKSFKIVIALLVGLILLSIFGVVHSATPAGSLAICEGQPAGCADLFKPLNTNPVPEDTITLVSAPTEPAIAGKHAKNKTAKPLVSEEGNLSTIEFTKPILADLTPEYIAGVKAVKIEQLNYLKEMEVKYQLPEGTLRVKWFIESMAGKLNIKNGDGYEGHFQIGAWEQKKYGISDPYDFKQATHGAIRLLRDYHVLMQGYAKDIIPWNSRSRADFYLTHNQGANGTGQQYNAMHYNVPISAKVIRNMCNNIPSPYHSLVCAPKNKKHKQISDAQFAMFFKRMWEIESDRIWNEIKK